MQGIADDMKGILSEIADMDFTHPHAWDMAELRLDEALNLVNLVRDAYARGRHLKNMAVIDRCISKINRGNA